MSFRSPPASPRTPSLSARKANLFSPFQNTTKYFDIIHDGVNYKGEVNKVLKYIRRHFQTIWDGKKGKITLLEVGCGTGKYISLLKEYFTCQGLDSHIELLRIAKQQNPDVQFHQEDLFDFQLQEQTFDVIVCLHTIGFITSFSNLKKYMQTIHKYLKPGGLFILKPWNFTPDFKEDIPQLLTVNKPDIKLSRMHITKLKQTESESIALLHYKYMVCDKNGITSFEEIHEMGLFTQQQYEEAILASGITKVEYDKDVFGEGQGIFIGTFGQTERKKKKVYCKVVCSGDWTAQLNYLVEKGWVISDLLHQMESKYRELDDYGKPLASKPFGVVRGIGWYDIKTQCILLEKDE